MYSWEFALNLMKNQEQHFLWEYFTSFSRVALAGMGGDPVGKVVDLEMWNVAVDVVIVSKFPQFILVLDQPFGNHVVDGHVLEVEGFLAVEALTVVCVPEGVSLKL